MCTQIIKKLFFIKNSSVLCNNVHVNNLNDLKWLGQPAGVIGVCGGVLNGQKTGVYSNNCPVSF